MRGRTISALYLGSFQEPLGPLFPESLATKSHLFLLPLQHRKGTCSSLVFPAPPAVRPRGVRGWSRLVGMLREHAFPVASPREGTELKGLRGCVSGQGSLSMAIKCKMRLGAL